MERLPLKTYLDTVEQKLAQYSADQLRAILRQLAQQQDPEQRQSFLAQLQPPDENLTPVQQKLQDSLLDEIASLAAEIEDAMEDAEPEYEEYDNYGDDEDDENHYESFYAPLSALFDRAQAAFDYGQFELAADAYHDLFEILDLEDDYGGRIEISALPGVDRNESRSRYLRAVYEVENLEQRPEALWDAMLDVLSWLGAPRPMFSDVIQISPKPLADQKPFLSAWIDLLKGETGSEADAWLREAVRLAAGVQGLVDLVRAEGPQRPRVYLDWFAALEEEKRYAEVLAAAQDALRALPQDLPIRAAIADHLCAAAVQLQKESLLRFGRMEAFRAKPELRRLLDLWEATPPAERSMVMTQAIGYAQEAESRSREPQNYVNQEDDLEKAAYGTDSLLHAQLLAQQWRTVQQRAAGEPILGWSGSSSTQGFILSFLLIKLSGRLPANLPTNLAKLWQDRLQASIGYASYSSAANGLQTRLNQAYTDLFPTLEIDQAAQETALTWCLNTANQRVDAIVGGQHRKSYDKAALVIAACAETLQLRHEPTLAAGLIDHVHSRFPRHRAFISELDSAIRLKK